MRFNGRLVVGSVGFQLLTRLKVKGRDVEGFSGVGRRTEPFDIATNPLSICRSRVRSFVPRVIGERAQRLRNTSAAD
jgi:hypothetical protein